MPLIVGLDTEYTRGVGEFSLPEWNGSRNRVLSYQLWFLDTGTSREGGIVIPVENGHKLSGRLTLASLLGKGFIFAKQAGIVGELPDKIILAAHFCRADLPSLRDFKQLKRKVDAVRNTYVSAKQPFVQDIYVHGRRHRLSITMVDTMLLAPAGHQSLAALGDLLDIEKVELPDGTIERMDILQRENPELFEKYALRDAEIAAKWVRKISAFFTAELGLNLDRYPVTLGSAGVKMFLGGPRSYLFGLKNIRSIKLLAVSKSGASPDLKCRYIASKASASDLAASFFRVFVITSGPRKPSGLRN